jgi:mannosyltransferase OCH1-like enzyme
MPIDALQLVTLPFDSAMQQQSYQWIIDRKNTKDEVGVSGAWLYDYFKKQWEEYAFAALTDCSMLRIPKILHQIWIGDGVPVELQGFQTAWIIMHPDWEYYLWTQHNIDALPLINRTYIDNAQNPAEKADLLRIELLYFLGGVYVDMDCEPLVPLDVLNYMYDFFVGIHPLDTGLVKLGSAIIGSCPGHPILKACIDGIPANYANPALENSITCKTGPVHLTRQFIVHANKHGLRDCALPAPYFYPLGATQDYYAPDAWKKIGAFSVHHWAKTWNKPQYRRARFRNIKSWGVLL